MIKEKSGGNVMHFTIQRDRLIQGVQDVMKAVTSRTTIPILTGIKIIVDDEGVTLTGSDSDISIESFIPKEDDEEEIVEIHESGGVVLQAKFFHDIVKKLPMEIVEIEVVNHFQTVIRSGKAEFNLNGLDPAEYPHLPQISEENMFTIPSDILKTVIKQTVFAVSTTETRPILTGVNWKITNGELTCVATDSYRLAMRKVSIESKIDSEFNIVIPGKSLNELSKLLGDSNDVVEIVMTENQALFKMKDLLFYSRLLEGNYPNTAQLIPTISKTDISIGTKEFMQAIDRASLLARDGVNNNVVKLSTLENGLIEISSHSPEVGKVVEEVQSENVTGEELKISFSPKYMLDALKAFDDQEITIQFTGAMSPFIIQPVNDRSILQLILPVRTF